jgi:CRAL/TRIO domain
VLESFRVCSCPISFVLTCTFVPQRLVSELTPAQLEVAARTSYAYWLSTRGGNQIASGSDVQEESASCLGVDDHHHETNRMKSAMREARRHYLGEHRNYEKALASLREACDFRIEWKLDLLREIGQSSTFLNASNFNADDGHDDCEIMQRYRGYLEDELGKQPNIVGGQDRYDRAVIVRWGRSNATLDYDGFLLTQIYTAERAIAATEIQSMGKEEKIILLVDLSNYDRRHVPPIAKVMEACTKLQRLYPERILHSILLDPPLWARMLHATIKPFLTKRTRRRIIMISGQEEKDTTLADMIDVANALPVFTSDGKLQQFVDIPRFLNGTVFHSPYTFD